MLCRSADNWQDSDEDGAYHGILSSKVTVDCGLRFECGSWSFVAFVGCNDCFRLH